MRIAYLRRTDRQTDRGTSALVELRFAAKKWLFFLKASLTVFKIFKFSGLGAERGTKKGG